VNSTDSHLSYSKIDIFRCVLGKIDLYLKRMRAVFGIQTLLYWYGVSYLSINYGAPCMLCKVLRHTPNTKPVMDYEYGGNHIYHRQMKNWPWCWYQHNDCKDVAILKDIAENVKTSVQFNEVEQLIDELMKTVDKIRTNRETNLVDVSSEHQTCDGLWIWRESHIPQTDEELAMMLISCNIWFMLSCKFKVKTFVF
jgi:hypothetical protein